MYGGTHYEIRYKPPRILQGVYPRVYGGTDLGRMERAITGGHEVYPRVYGGTIATKVFNRGHCVLRSIPACTGEP